MLQKLFPGFLFQFTPLREGRLRRHRLELLRLHISIHAPPRGATVHQRGNSVVKIISIHAPPRGATRQTAPQPTADGNFNSRPSARGDQTAPQPHSPTADFNSRPSARGDAAARNCPDSRAGFQFTPLREGRLYESWDEMKEDTISIHAPPRGATPARTASSQQPADFNSRPSARGDGKAAEQPF